MKLRLLPIAAAVFARTFASGNAQEQTKSGKRNDRKMVPLLNKDLSLIHI